MWRALYHCGRGGDEDGLFDGLIDDVRYSRGVLSEGEVLFTTESVLESTVGYWRFEPQPGVMRIVGRISWKQNWQNRKRRFSIRGLVPFEICAIPC